MAKVKVVNRQVIDGMERNRGDVIEVAPGRARDLIAAGKATAGAAKPAPAKPIDKPVAVPVEKGGK